MNKLTGSVLKHGDYRMIADEGMPRYRQPFEKGRLLISFVVDFPQDNFIGLDKIAQLKKLLPPVDPVEVPVDAEECIMQPFDASMDSSHTHHNGSGRSAEVYDSDDEDTSGHGHGGQRMQCAQS